MENLTTNTGAGLPPAPIFFYAKTVTVIVRHSAACNDKHRGGEWRKCRCPKALPVYEGQGSGTNRRVSAKTRSWEQAEKRAQEVRDSWNPEKQELKRLPNLKCYPALRPGECSRGHAPDAQGVLPYRRKKTGELAVVPLLEHVRTLLRDIPLERDSIGPEMPFRSKTSELFSDTRKWEHRYEALFRLAGITEVKTDLRVRKPHAYMLMHTFAVWYLTHGASLHTTSRMLGHAKTETTQKAYLPWVREMQQYHIDDARKAQQARAQLVNNGHDEASIAESNAKTSAA